MKKMYFAVEQIVYALGQEETGIRMTEASKDGYFRGGVLQLEKEV